MPTPNAELFTLDLYQALIEQLPIALDALPTATLVPQNIAALGSGRGVYQLWHNGIPRYFGKSETTLAERLEQHRRRCLGRVGLDVSDMSFKCLFLDRFVDAAAPEKILIRHYMDAGQADWNLSVGFGPKDVGRERDSGIPGSWFTTYLPDFLALVTLPSAGSRLPITEFLVEARSAIPFLFRYASPRSNAPLDKSSIVDYNGISVVVPAGPQTPLDILRLIVSALPDGWQATVLPHAAILYKERKDYVAQLAGWRSTASGVVAL